MRRIPFAILGILSLSLTFFASARADTPHSYYEWLSSRPELLHKRSYRTQAEIDADIHGKPGPVAYDANEDAARTNMSANSGSATQVRPTFTNVSSGNILYFWEGKWEDGFVDVADGQSFYGHKAFQLAQTGSSDNRRIEVRTRFTENDTDTVAWIDHRRYIWGAPGDLQPMGRDGCPGNPGYPDTDDCQSATFYIEPDTWTRFWALVDFDAGTYSFWMADEDTAPVQLFDDFPITPNGGGSGAGLNQFWFEYNSSQPRTGPALNIWFRNFVVLKDVADTSTVVEQGADFGAGPPAPDELPAPENLKIILDTTGSGQGSIAIDQNQASYSAGQSVTLTAVPESGSASSGWSGNLVSQEYPSTIVVASNLEMAANFSEVATQPLSQNAIEAAL